MTYSIRDFENDTPPRIFGTETEYTTRIDGRLVVLELPYLLGTHATRITTDEKGFWLTTNGALIYVDYGGVVEYATPECSSPLEAAIHEKAGEHIIRGAVEVAANHTRDESNLFLHRRTGMVAVPSNSSPNEQALSIPTSTANHENYFAPAITDQGDNNHHRLHQLRGYLSTRGVWAGSGIVDTDGFHTTQKKDAIKFTSPKQDFVTHGDKAPFYHKLDNGTSRLEIRLGDGNMSPWVTTQKLGLTSLVLRMIEHGRFPDSLVFSKATAQNAFVNATHVGDYGIRYEIERRQSPSITATEHQRRIAIAALDFANHHPSVPQQEVQAAENVIALCDDIDLFDGTRASLGFVADRLDWAAKLDGIFAVSTLADVHTGNLDAVRRDLMWETLHLPNRRRVRFEKHALHLLGIEADAVDRAMTTAPETRARWRAQMLSGDDSTAITWSKVGIGSKYIKSMPSPYGRDRIIT